MIAASTEKSRSLLTRFLSECGYPQTVCAGSGGEARRLMREGQFELVVINAPLKDEFGHDLALQAATATSAGVVLLVKADHADETSSRVEDEGVIVVPKPINVQMFYQSIKIVASMRKQILGLKNENVKLQQTIEDIRMVNRAKCVLIQYLNLTEPQAHRYIEKQAMDRRLTRREVAEGILQAYGD